MAGLQFQYAKSMYKLPSLKEVLFVDAVDCPN